jgi:hypothetical protein
VRLISPEDSVTQLLNYSWLNEQMAIQAWKR